ncbi:hypothetical protein DXV76_12815 [Rhodobacteraceae bacterium CCMM004]|nr:hypothetical protein DXV76_12815 [Rhodobacteraceae bacterium CCMM004]
MSAAAEKPRILPLPCARMLSRGEAAAYVGVSPVTFDKMIRDRMMPPAKRIYNRTLWDVRQLDSCLEDIPGGVVEAPNPWDDE